MPLTNMGFTLLILRIFQSKYAEIRGRSNFVPIPAHLQEESAQSLREAIDINEVAAPIEATHTPFYLCHVIYSKHIV